ncbi:hypothetical protein K492DRAFT_210055 [Lichtheimia hyalospora FSU 10163]|nr:hypothetical protein K492DRAFT_210055 [Lichtheimia hyalospora FSU 10163]
MANESTAQQQDNNFLLNLIALCSNNNTPQTSTSNVPLPTPSRSWVFDMNTESKVPIPVSTFNSMSPPKPVTELESSQPNQAVPVSMTPPLPSPPSSFRSSTPPYVKQDHQESKPWMNNQQHWQKKRKGNFQNKHHADESMPNMNRNDYNNSHPKKRSRHGASPAHHHSVDTTNTSTTSSIPTSSGTEERMYNAPRDPRKRQSPARHERLTNTRQAHSSISNSIRESQYSSPQHHRTTNDLQKPKDKSTIEEEEKDQRPLCSYISFYNCDKKVNCPFRHEGDRIDLVCRHFKTNSCSKGAKCPFLHDLSVEPCRFFHIGDSCKLGQDCPYSHEKPLTRELLVRLRSLTEECKYYHEKGYCTNGDDCLFIH